MEKPRDFDLLIAFAQERVIQFRSWAMGERAKGKAFPDYWDEEADKWELVIKRLEEWFA